MSISSFILQGIGPDSSIAYLVRDGLEGVLTSSSDRTKIRILAHDRDIVISDGVGRSVRISRCEGRTIYIPNRKNRSII